MMSIFGLGIALYSGKEIVKGINRNEKKKQLQRTHNTNVSDVLNAIGGERYILTQTNAIKQRYINYLNSTYGLNDTERELYEKKFDKYVAIKKRNKVRKNLKKAQDSLDEYKSLKHTDRWRRNGNQFRIELYNHCDSNYVNVRMNKTINNTFLKEIVYKSWIHNGKERLLIKNVNNIYKSNIKKWYKNCWIKENGKWTH